MRPTFSWPLLYERGAFPFNANASIFLTAVPHNAVDDRLKINCVVMNGVNTDELADFLEFTRDQELDVRFIEWMPFDDNRWKDDKFFSYQV